VEKSRLRNIKEVKSGQIPMDKPMIFGAAKEKDNAKY
jgi:hypothetical protein